MESVDQLTCPIWADESAFSNTLQEICSSETGKTTDIKPELPSEESKQLDDPVKNRSECSRHINGNTTRLEEGSTNDLLERRPGSIQNAKKPGSSSNCHHSVPTKHMCDICGKIFKRAHNLKIHGRIHSGDMPFVCSVENCQKKFRWKSSIVSHMKWHQSRNMRKSQEEMHCSPSARRKPSDGDTKSESNIEKSLATGKITAANQANIFDILNQEICSQHLNQTKTENTALEEETPDNTVDVWDDSLTRSNSNIFSSDDCLMTEPQYTADLTSADDGHILAENQAVICENSLMSNVQSNECSSLHYSVLQRNDAIQNIWRETNFNALHAQGHLNLDSNLIFSDSTLSANMENLESCQERSQDGSDIVKDEVVDLNSPAEFAAENYGILSYSAGPFL